MLRWIQPSPMYLSLSLSRFIEGAVSWKFLVLISDLNLDNRPIVEQDIWPKLDNRRMAEHEIWPKLENRPMVEQDIWPKFR